MIVVLVVLVLIYFILVRQKKEEPGLVSVENSDLSSEAGNIEESLITKEFLGLLLNVREIQINDEIFSSPSFTSLRDTTIKIMGGEGGEKGRANPFAPVGSDISASVVESSTDLNTDLDETEPILEESIVSPVEPVVKPKTIVSPTAPKQ